MQHYSSKKVAIFHGQNLSFLPRKNYSQFHFYTFIYPLTDFFYFIEQKIIYLVDDYLSICVPNIIDHIEYKDKYFIKYMKFPPQNQCPSFKLQNDCCCLIKLYHINHLKAYFDAVVTSFKYLHLFQDLKSKVLSDNDVDVHTADALQQMISDIVEIFMYICKYCYYLKYAVPVLKIVCRCKEGPQILSQFISDIDEYLSFFTTHGQNFMTENKYSIFHDMYEVQKNIFITCYDHSLSRNLFFGAIDRLAYISNRVMVYVKGHNSTPKLHSESIAFPSTRIVKAHYCHCFFSSDFIACFYNTFFDSFTDDVINGDLDMTFKLK